MASLTTRHSDISVIIDAVIFDGERECLNIRREELADVVDCRIIIEGRKTLLGYNKASMYRSNQITEHAERYLLVDVPGAASSATEHDREQILFDAVGPAVLAVPQVSDDDIVLISRANEIPSSHTVRNIIQMCQLGQDHWPANVTMPTVVETDEFRYKLNMLAGGRRRDEPIATTVGRLGTRSAYQERTAVPSTAVKLFQAGWRYIDLGRAIDVLPDYLKLVEVPIERTPRPIRDNPDRWRHLIWTNVEGSPS